jgi:hypothetical protein
VPTFADRGCHVVRVTHPYGRVLGFLDRKITVLANKKDRLCGLVVRVLGVLKGRFASPEEVTAKMF